MGVEIEGSSWLKPARQDLRAAPTAHVPLDNPCLPILPTAAQMRKVQDKLAELQAEHAAQIEAVTAQYGALLQQVRTNSAV